MGTVVTSVPHSSPNYSILTLYLSATDQTPWSGQSTLNLDRKHGQSRKYDHNLVTALMAKVLGAAMFYARVGDASMVYTGDYNMTPDRHLGAAQIDRLQLDLVITESTYATTVRDSKYVREREFLKAVHKCIAGGGKVLIPTFALGRAQELCILLEDFWERMNLNIPIYFSSGLTIQANMYYKMLINWTSQKLKETYMTHNAFDFKHVCNFDRSMIHNPGPCVLFATPGMISGGFSLEVFKHWAPSEKNLVTLPGYCVAGTIGHKLMSGKPTKIDLDQDTKIDVRCQIHQLSFSPHTDSKGIMDLLKFLSPKHVILVHGEKPNMAKLTEKIERELQIKCDFPPNNGRVHIPSTHLVKANASPAFVRSCMSPNFIFKRCSSDGKSSHSLGAESTSTLEVHDVRVAEGILVRENNEKPMAIHQNELLLGLGEEKHEIHFAYCCPVYIGDSSLEESHIAPKELNLLQVLHSELVNLFPGLNIQDLGDFLLLGSFRVRVCAKDDCPHRTDISCVDPMKVAFCCCDWSSADDTCARKLISEMENMTLKAA